jgi:RND family efflux transporter MFP subunit
MQKKMWGLCLAGAAALAVAACGGTADGSEAAEATGAGFARVINVEVETLRMERFVEQVRLTGTVHADRDVTVAAEESGRVIEVLVEKGARVEEGAPLVRLDAELLEAQVDQAAAAASLAEETWQRRKRLWEEDGVGSELAYLQARADAEQTAATLRNLRERLARTVIRAPFAGSVEDRMVEVGSLVATGTPVVRVVDVTPLEVVAGVPERYAPDVRPGAVVTVRFDVFPDETFEGRVRFVGSTVDARSRTFPVEVTLPNRSGLVKPEMVANVSVERRALDDVLVVPQDAVVRVENGFVVFVVAGPEGEERAEARPVTIRASQANRVAIEGDVEAGERLVVTGQQTLAAGDRVRIVGDR